MVILICGGDEAGRGAVIGPLVVSLVAVKKGGERKLVDIGVRDSKLLSRKKREYLYDAINEVAHVVVVGKISAAEINATMKNKISLNELEAVHFAKLLDKIDDHVSTLYLDSPDVIAEKFGMRVKMISLKPTKVAGMTSKLQKGVRFTKIISEHKADARYAVVSAASIIAKVIRDAEMKKLAKSLKMDLNSGYPSDYKTIESIRKNLSNKQLLQHIRDRWSTIANIKQTKLYNFS